jgi:hypothetical protein
MSRESMDEMLQRVRDYVFQTDQALKESQRHICRDGAGQLETSALKEIRCSSCLCVCVLLARTKGLMGLLDGHVV